MRAHKVDIACARPQTFWVTETQALTEGERTGILVRGNLRDERTKVFEHVSRKVRLRVCAISITNVSQGLGLCV